MASAPFIDKRYGQWYMKYKPDPKGGWVRVPLGKHPAPFPPSKPPKKPPQFVLDRAREFTEIEYRAKHHIGPTPAREKGLASFAEDYLQAFKVTHSEKAYRDSERNVHRFVEFAVAKGVTSIQGISRAICRDYMEARQAKGVTTASLQTEKGHLSPLMTRAVTDELIPANPWTYTKVPGKKAEHKPTFWTAEQVVKIAEACDKPWHSDLVLLLANTGIRTSATLNMQWDWINWELGTISIPSELDKAKKGYSVAMSPVARDILQRRIMTSKGSKYVFPNPSGKAFHYATFRVVMIKATAKAGVPLGTPHDLRHTFARLLIASNAPINVVQATLGHSSITMTQRYTKVDERAAAPHMDQFGIGPRSTTPPTSDQPPPPSGT